MRAAFVAVAALGCGDAMVPTDFEGAPVLHRPNFAIVGDAPAATRPVYATFWHPDGYSSLSWEDGVEQAHTRLPLVSFTFQPFNLFEHPAARLLASTAAGGRYGIAAVQAYDDRNGNGWHDPDEPWLGYARRGLLFAPSALTAAESPTGRPLAAGYHPVDLPLSCVPIEVGDSDACETPLGAICEGDGDCGEGACLGQTLFEEQGYCGLPADECRPRDGALTVDFVEPDGLRFTWLQRCDADADCGSDGRRFCDVSLGACRPDAGFVLQVGAVLPEAPCKLVEELIEDDDDDLEPLPD